MRLIDDTTDPDTLAHRNARWEMRWHWMKSSGAVCKDPRRASDALRADRYLAMARQAAKDWHAKVILERESQPKNNVIPFFKPNNPSV